MEDQKNKSSDFEIQGEYHDEFNIRLDTDEPQGFGESIDDLDDSPKSSLKDILQDKKKLGMVIGVGLIFIIIIFIIIIGAKKGRKPIPELGAAPMPYVDKTVTEQTLRFAPDDVYRLRQIGYTGREIQEAEVNGYDANEMYSRAEQERDNYLKERFKFLSKDITDVEVRKLLDNTWYGFPQQTVGEVAINPDTGEEDLSQVFSTPIRENVDYERVPFYGHQTILKLKLSGGIEVFHAIDPTVYLTLLDKGNVVVSYNKLQYRGAVFIMNIRVEEF